MFKEILLPKISEEELEIVQEISYLRPKPNRAIDQIYMKPICMLVQIKLISSYLNDKDILFMGDGDHMSILLSILCGIYDKPKSMTVLDIDPRIIKSIKKASNKYNLKIDTFKYNVLDPLPEKFIRKFNFFYTNPPYGSKNGGQSGVVFISRCMEACSYPSQGCIILPHDNERKWTKEVMKNTQKFLCDYGWIITEKINGLHTYYLDDATLASCTTIVEQVKEVVPPISGKSVKLNLY